MVCELDLLVATCELLPSEFPAVEGCRDPRGGPGEPGGGGGAAGAPLPQLRLARAGGRTHTRLPAPHPHLHLAQPPGEAAGLQTLSPVDNLFPALVDCFGIILLGYLAGR